MNRLTTDTPNNNLEAALNLFYVKESETLVRGGGPAPKYEDVTLLSFMRRLISAHRAEIEADDDESLCEVLSECLMDDPETIEGLLALFYTSAWAFSVLRDRLKVLEDAPSEHTHNYAPASHNQAASTITAGTFGGQVAAAAGSQPAGAMLLRNSRLSPTEANPTNNGEIVWVYE